MKKFLSILGIIILVAVIVSMTILLVLKIKNDTIAKRDEDIMAQNEKAESEYICKNANEKLQEIIANIKIIALKINFIFPPGDVSFCSFSSKKKRPYCSIF